MAVNDWQPIATVPKDRPVELATFPAKIGAHVPNVCIGADLSVAWPEATHWREVSAETAEAVFRSAPKLLQR